MSGKAHRPTALQTVTQKAPNPPTVVKPPIPDDAKKLSLFDEKNAYSLVRLLPTALANRLKAVNRDLFLIKEEDFEAAYKPDEVDCRLRLKFWDEWLAVIHEPGKQIQPQNVYYGVCTAEYFFAEIIGKEEKFVWMLMPPTDYEVALREIFYKSVQRLREIIQLPFVQKVPLMMRGGPVMGPDGQPIFYSKIDRGLITEIRQTAQMLADRVVGAVAQKWQIDQRSLSVNLSGAADGALPAPETKPVGYIPDDEVAAFERQLRMIDQQLAPYGSEEYVLEAERVLNAKEKGSNGQNAPEKAGEASSADVRGD